MYLIGGNALIVADGAKTSVIQHTRHAGHVLHNVPMPTEMTDYLNHVIANRFFF